MERKFKNGGVYLTGPDGFDIGQTLECGQCFRFEKKDGLSYTIVAHDRILNARRENEKIFLYPCPRNDFENIWTHYFDLNNDYTKIKAALSEGDEIMREAIKYGPGIRILNQDKWETLVSFIISQNKQIQGIKKIIGNISREYGEDIGNGEFSFPGADRLKGASVDDLLRLKTGFRAKYIADAVKKTVSGELDFNEMEKLPDGQLYEKLTGIYGVGPKVANCVMLFSFGRRESFPVDVWVGRAVRKFYFKGEPVSSGEIKKFSEKKFGRYGGYAQQFLFNYARGTGISTR